MKGSLKNLGKSCSKPVLKGVKGSSNMVVKGSLKSVLLVKGCPKPAVKGVKGSSNVVVRGSSKPM